MKIFHIRKKEFATFLLFLISPLFSLPLILVGIYKREKSAFILFSLFMGLFSFLTFPASDLYRHFESYFLYESLPWSYFIETLPGDIFTQLLSYVSANCGIPYEFNRLLTMTMFFLIILFVFNHIIDSSTLVYSRSEIFIRLLICIFLVDYFTALIGVRSGLATIFYLLGIYLAIDCGNKKKMLLCFIMAALIHYSLTFMILVSFFFSLLPQRKFSILLSFLLCTVISGIIIDRLEIYFVAHDMIEQAAYVGDGQWGSGGKELASFRGLMYGWIKRLTILPFIIVWYRYTSNNDYWGRQICGLALLYVLTFNLGTISSRVYWMLVVMLGFYVCKVESLQKIKLHCIKVLFAFAVLFLCAQLFSRRDFLRVSNYSRLVWPVPMILTQHYDINAVYRQLNEEELIRR